MSIPDIFGSAILEWSKLVSASRSRQGLPPLTDPGGQIAIGQEELMTQLDAPRIIIVPQGLRNFQSRQPGGPSIGGISAINPTLQPSTPKMLWSAELWFTAHFWGDEWPGNVPKPIFWDFNTTLELAREFSMAIYRSASGALGRSVQMGDLEFEQPTDKLRRGRKAVLPFAFVIPILDDPFIKLEYGAHPEVEIDLTIEGPNDVAGNIVLPGS